MNTSKIDVTKEHCPMTFVKAKVALSKLQKGDRLEVLLLEGEPLENVPRSATENGYSIIGISRVVDNVHRVIIEK
jgi:TusA-related sulfurtransferase